MDLAVTKTEHNRAAIADGVVPFIRRMTRFVDMIAK
jgi:hypothetical protein